MSAWTFTDDGPLRILTLDHGDLNLYDAEVEEGLFDAIHALTADPPRAVLIRAEGKVWTGGVEVERFAGISAEQGAVLWKRQFDLMHELEDLPCPVIFASHGLTLTWGLELALACDMVVAARDARFGLPEVTIGLVPTCGALFRGPRALPHNVARELVLTGDPIPATRAHELGLVNRLAEPGEALAGAVELAERVCRNAAVAVRECLAATPRAIGSDDEGWAATDHAAAAIRASDDAAEGVRAFLEKRPPVWTGR